MRTHRTIRIVLAVAAVGIVLALASENRAADFRFRVRVRIVRGSGHVRAGNIGGFRRARMRTFGGRTFRQRRFIRRPILVTRPLQRVVVIRNTASYPNQSVVYVTTPVSRHSAVAYAAPSRRSSCRTGAATTHRRR